MTRETVHTRALRRAAAILGGADQLRSYLRVPKTTLELWLQGLEALPANVFLRIVDLVLDHDLPGGRATAGSAQGGAPAAANTQSPKLQVHVGPNAARCPACDCVDFLPTVPGAVLDHSTVLTCSSCGLNITRGDLVVGAADEGAKRSAAALNRLKRQQAEAQQPAQSQAEAKTSKKD